MLHLELTRVNHSIASALITLTPLTQLLDGVAKYLLQGLRQAECTDENVVRVNRRQCKANDTVTRGHMQA